MDDDDDDDRDEYDGDDLCAEPTCSTCGGEGWVESVAQ
jgi:hypothetical protein